MEEKWTELELVKIGKLLEERLKRDFFLIFTFFLRDFSILVLVCKVEAEINTDVDDLFGEVETVDNFILDLLLVREGDVTLVERESHLLKVQFELGAFNFVWDEKVGENNETKKKKLRIAWDLNLASFVSSALSRYPLLSASITLN